MPTMLARALTHLVAGITTLPDQVRVDSQTTARGERLAVRVAPTDIGRVIGRSGRTAGSLRTVIAALGDGGQIRIDVVDTDLEPSA